MESAKRPRIIAHRPTASVKPVGDVESDDDVVMVDADDARHRRASSCSSGVSGYDVPPNTDLESEGDIDMSRDDDSGHESDGVKPKVVYKVRLLVTPGSDFSLLHRTIRRHPASPLSRQSMI